MKKNTSIRFCSIIAFNLAIFAILLGMTEGICRVAGIPYHIDWTPTENAVARFDKESGWAYLPNLSATQESPHYSIQVHFDENGIRVPSPEFQFDHTKPSVLFVGGSFTMGHGLPYDECFVGQFANLEESPYQVVNLGVQGYGSDQALLTLKKFLPKFDTKVVVYTFIWGHITRNGNYDRRLLHPDAKYLGTKPLFALDRNQQLYLAKTPVLYEDYLNSWLWDALKIKVGGRLGWFPPFPEDLTKAIIFEMQRYCEENNAHFLVLNWRWTPQSYNDIFDGLEGLHHLDTMYSAPPNWNDMRIPGDGHPDARAGKRIGRLLLKYFQSEQWL